MSCQARILWESSLQLFHLRQAVFPAYSIDVATEDYPPQKVALRKISKSDRHQMPGATKAHERVFPLGSCNGFVLCGIPYRGWMSLRFLSALRTGFPLPHSGQATKATGRLHCYLYNFPRVAQATLQCKSRIALFLALLRDFLSITTGPCSCNSQDLWKGSQFCGKPLTPAPDQGVNLPKAAK